MKTFLLSIILLFFAACQSLPQADYILHHGKIYTCDSSFLVVEAVAVKDGKILATGSNQEILNGYKADSTVDLQSQAVYPGLIDAHAHFYGYGKGLFEVNLWGCTSEAEMIQRVKEFAERNPNLPWIIGRGWDQNLWTNKSMPNFNLLNGLKLSQPVFLTRVDGHAALVNEVAWNRVDPKNNPALGGKVVLYYGNFSGLLIDGAMDLVQNIIPQPSKEDMEKYLLSAQKNCLAEGMVALHDAGLKSNIIDAIHELKKSGDLKMDFHLMMDGTDETTLKKYLKSPIVEDGFLVKSVKLYADGALGSRGALLKHEYHDRHDYYGIRVTSLDSMEKVARRCQENGIQLCTHAIGDSANHDVLRIYSQLIQKGNPLRWRIEHAQIVDPADFPLFKQYSIIPSVQPSHATSDHAWAPDRLGTYVTRGYQYKKLWDCNGFLPLGSDFPVESIRPVLQFYAAIARKTTDGKPQGGFQMNEALTRQQALLGLTRFAAYSMQMDDQMGSIEKGKWAHFTVFDQDIMSIPVEKIPNVSTKYTIIRGNIAYSK